MDKLIMINWKANINNISYMADMGKFSGLEYCEKDELKFVKK